MTPKKPMTTKYPVPRCLALAALLAAAMTTTGCGSRDSGEQAIRKAKMDMETLSATYDPATGAGGKTTYQKVVQELSGAAESSHEGVASAARTLRARAYMRMGDEASARASSLQRAAEDQAVRVRAYHNQWLDLDAQAQALRAYDPANDLKQIDAQIAENEKSIAKANADLADAEKQLKGLSDESAAALDQARAKRDREIELRTQMIEKSQTERLELVKQANQAKREGDGFDKAAADLMANASKVRPQIDEFRMRVHRLETQKDMLNAAREQLVKSAERSRQQAERAQKGGKDDKGGMTFVGAQQVGEALTEATGSLEKAMAAIEDPTSEASGLYKQALNEASRAKAGGGGPGGGSDAMLAQAAVHQAQADLSLVRAKGLGSYSDLLKLLAETKPALPGASGYADEAKKASASAKEFLDTAQSEFTEAKDLYERAGSARRAQEVKDRLEEVAKTLASLGQAAPAAPASGEAATAPETAPAPADQGAPVAEHAPAPAANLEGAQGEVVALFQQISQDLKEKNYEGLMSLLLFRNDAQRETFSKLTPLLTKMDLLDEACRSQFGRGFYDLLEEAVSQQGFPNAAKAQTTGDRALARLRTLDPSDLEVTVQAGGEDAEVTSKSARTAEPLQCTKRDGKWLLKLDYELEGGINADAFLQAQGKVVDTIIENIKNSKYGNDSRKMLLDFSQESFKAAADVLRPKDDNK